MTWKELKEAINELTKEQLNYQVTHLTIYSDIDEYKLVNIQDIMTAESIVNSLPEGDTKDELMDYTDEITLVTWN